MHCWWNQKTPSLEIAREYLNFLANECGYEVRTELRGDTEEDLELVVEGYLTLDRGWAELHELNTPIGLGNPHTRVITYTLGRVTHDPGVGYYRDGSGQPPSDDWDPIFMYASWQSACLALMKLVASDRLDRAASNDAENEWGEQENKALEELDERIALGL